MFIRQKGQPFDQVVIKIFDDVDVRLCNPEISRGHWFIRGLDEL